jgi:hypothetical protein
MVIKKQLQKESENDKIPLPKYPSVLYIILIKRGGLRIKDAVGLVSPASGRDGTVRIASGTQYLPLRSQLGAFPYLEPVVS